MKKENTPLNIHIGSIIKAKASERGISETRLAQMIHCSCSTMNDIYRRTSINTEQLRKISEVLEYNFFTEIYGKYIDSVLPHKQHFGTITIVIDDDEVCIEQKNGISKITEYTKKYEK